MSYSISRLEPVSGIGPFTITFHPLAGGLEVGLAPDPAAGVLRVTLVRIGHRWHNAFHEVTIREADDLFACAALAGSVYDLMPGGAELIELTLEVELAGCPQPLLVELKPPDTIRLAASSEALQRLLGFLKRRGFVKTADPNPIT